AESREPRAESREPRAESREPRAESRGQSSYYFQPIVVKRMADSRWELVDGQQRLTTLFLILRDIRRPR
ncbi:hypothetical protein TV39_04800, partial [Arthrobacter sp. SPG23]|uniref:DUF262 domain-containing protein n=1 Tax=Arthrobacter sp. SPG23 TaxID=1610703 RepID=UPI0005BB541D